MNPPARGAHPIHHDSYTPVIRSLPGSTPRTPPLLPFSQASLIHGGILPLCAFAPRTLARGGAAPGQALPHSTLHHCKSGSTVARCVRIGWGCILRWDFVWYITTGCVCVCLTPPCLTTRLLYKLQNEAAPLQIGLTDSQKRWVLATNLNYLLQLVKSENDTLARYCVCVGCCMGLCVF